MSASLAYSLLLALATAQLGDAAPLQARDGPALVPTGTSVKGWTSIGCYQDTLDLSQQILTHREEQPEMTFDTCAAFCSAGNYQYMGFSDSDWCYCDQDINLHNGLGYATDADKCNMACAGDATTNCGAFWTNTMFQLTTSYEAAFDAPAPWVPTDVTCIAEGSSGRALTGASFSAPDMTYPKCLDFCASKGFAIAGLEYSDECYCGSFLNNGASLSLPSTQCNMACSGSPSRTCGGPGALTLFVVPSGVTGLSSTLTPQTPSLPSGWSIASTSCIAEGSTGRALNGASTSSADMTGAKCAAYCGDRGFQYAGVEYSEQCYCGSSLANGASLDISSNACTMRCGGDSSSICGGPNALSLYNNPSIVPAPTGPFSGAIPSGWSVASSACIKEVRGRALTGASTTGSDMTTATCLGFCEAKGFQYAGLEYARECYCGNSLVNSASLDVTSDKCNMACTGDSFATCGGPDALQLYVNPALAPVAPAPTVINGFTSSGCIQEVAGRALTGLRVNSAVMTLELCTTSCATAGFTYAGVEYGQECYCGSGLTNGASTSLVSGQCVMDCPGNSAEKCGGPNAIQLFIAM